MINYAVLEQTLSSLVGFRQEPGLLEPVPASLFNSEAGAYFQDSHPLVSLSVLSAIAPKDLVNAHYPEAVVGAGYSKGSIVRQGPNILWEALEDAEFKAEPAFPWEKTTVFAQWVKSKVKASANRVLQAVLANSIMNKNTKQVLSSFSAFEPSGEPKALEPGTGYRGYMFRITRNGVSLKINRLGVRTTKDCSIEVLLFNAAKVTTPAFVIQMNAKAGLDTWITLPGLKLDTTEASRDWFICIDQSALLLNDCELEVSQGLCKSVVGVDVTNFETANFETVDTVFDNTGLLVEAAVVCDYTDLFERNKLDFVPLLKLQFAVDILRECLYNPNARVNRTAALAARADIAYALDGDTAKFSRRSGLSYELTRAYEVFNLNTLGYSSPCFRCAKKGVAYRSIG